MIYRIIGTGFVLALASCGGGGGKQALVDACVEEGESRENCTCVADLAEENLEADLFKKVVDAVQSGDSDLQGLGSNLTPAEIGQLTTFGLSVATSCQASFN
ncbi:MAG: hypothetical protein AAFS13_01630 [Pseudomonadota bacterium]